MNPDDRIDQRLRALEKTLANMPVRFAAVSGPNYPASIIKIEGKILTGGSNASGGFYGGRRLLGTADSAGPDAQVNGNNLTMPEGMVLDSSDNTVIIMNLAEDTLSTHTLPIPSYAVGIRVGAYIKDNGNGKALPGGGTLFAGTNTPIYAVSPGGGLPPGTGKYKVLQLVDDHTPGTPGWDYVRAHG